MFTKKYKKDAIHICVSKFATGFIGFIDINGHFSSRNYPFESTRKQISGSLISAKCSNSLRTNPIRKSKTGQN